MSWVKVTNGTITVEIPYQAFIDLYKRNGFVVVANNPTQSVVEKEKNNNAKSGTVGSNTKHKVSTAK